VGDEEMLGRAVDNLLANVHAHTPEGTTAVVTAYDDGDCVVVEVSDDGPGVPAAPAWPNGLSVTLTVPAWQPDPWSHSPVAIGQGSRPA
jgi:hypothetical protein